MRIILRIMRKLMIDALFSKTKQNILYTTLTNPDKWWYLSDLAKSINTSPSSLQRDLLIMTSTGILEKRQEGNRIYYRANRECPVFDELQGIIVKTVGIRDKLFFALKPISKKISVAFIFGSIARREEMSISDVDIMIIGETTISDVVKMLKPVEKIIDREINPTVYQINEFKKRLKDKNNFLMEVMEGEKVFIIGNENKLAEIS
jgi:predicted nucleotidyltransferase